MYLLHLVFRTCLFQVQCVADFLWPFSFYRTLRYTLQTADPTQMERLTQLESLIRKNQRQQPQKSTSHNAMEQAYRFSPQVSHILVRYGLCERWWDCKSYLMALLTELWHGINMVSVLVLFNNFSFACFISAFSLFFLRFGRLSTEFEHPGALSVALIVQIERAKDFMMKNNWVCWKGHGLRMKVKPISGNTHASRFN